MPSRILKMIKALIFDLDGTLLYTLDSISLSCNKVLAAHGLPPVTHEQLKHFVGDGVIDLMRRAFAAGGSSETVDDGIVAEFRACFQDDCDYRVAPYEGIKEVLHYCKAHGIQTACNTNKPHENAVKLMHKYFDEEIAFVQGNIPSVPKKPHPAGVQKLLEAMALTPQEAIYIGDSDVDMFTAKAAGMRSIGAGWGYRGEEELRASGAMFMAKEPRDIIEILKMQAN